MRVVGLVTDPRVADAVTEYVRGVLRAQSSRLNATHYRTRNREAILASPYNLAHYDDFLDVHAVVRIID